MTFFEHSVEQVFGPLADAQIDARSFRDIHAKSGAQAEKKPGKLATLLESKSIELKLAYPGLIGAIDAVRDTVESETIGTLGIRQAAGLVALSFLETSERLGQISSYMTDADDRNQN